jgi:phosphate-selective porin OprO and OprP
MTEIRISKLRYREPSAPGARRATRTLRLWRGGPRAAALSVGTLLAVVQGAAAQQDTIVVRQGRGAARSDGRGAQVSDSAASASDTTQSLEERIAQLDQEVRALKRLRELDKDSAAAKAKATPVVTAGQQGFGWRSADGAFQLRLRGYVQAEGRLFHDDFAPQLTNTFELRRARPILEATVYRSFDFKIMPDFGQGQTRLFDAYVAARIAPELRVTAGKFKAPLGLERLQSATDLLFIERAFPTALVPNRDVGLELSGSLGGQLVQYDVGIFNGAVDGTLNDGDQNGSKDFDARLYFTPFDRSDIAPLKGLSLGVGATLGTEHGTATNPALPFYRSPGQNTFFTYRTNGTAAGTAAATGRRRRIAPQAYYHWGRLGLLGEWTRSTQVVTLGGTTQTLGATAWQAAGSIALTGEDASFKGLTPRRPIEAGRGGFGALELVGRYSALIVDPAAFPVFANPSSAAQRAQEWAAGVNWYLERGVKVSVDYSHTTYRGGAPAGGDRQKEEVVLTQLQLAF